MLKLRDSFIAKDMCLPYRFDAYRVRAYKYEAESPRSRSSSLMRSSLLPWHTRKLPHCIHYPRLVGVLLGRRILFDSLETFTVFQSSDRDVLRKSRRFKMRPWELVACNCSGLCVGGPLNFHRRKSRYCFRYTTAYVCNHKFKMDAGCWGHVFRHCAT